MCAQYITNNWPVRLSNLLSHRFADTSFRPLSPVSSVIVFFGGTL